MGPTSVELQQRVETSAHLQQFRGFVDGDLALGQLVPMVTRTKDNN